MMKHVLLATLLASFSFTMLPLCESPALAAKRSKKKKKKKKKAPKKAAAEEKKKKAKEVKKPPPKRRKSTRNKTTGRKNSRLDPNSLSRWSNEGAMTPVVSEVPIQASLPRRARPISSRVETPGQGLTGKEEQVSARISLGAYHLETVAQDSDYVYNPSNPDDVFLVNLDRDIDLYRIRTDLNYTRIANTWLSFHLDSEYRGADSPTRYTDYRLNALYLSYGLSDARRRGEPDYGIALGRVAVREAGYAHADGISIRYKLLPKLILGAFGGFSGNPYRYNWLQKKTEEFSTKWWRAGGFISWQSQDYFVDLASVATMANHDDKGLERLFLFLKSGLSLTKTVDVFLSAWFDVLPDGQRFQNIQAIGSYRPFSNLYLRLALERFSTVSYRYATAQSYEQNPLGARIQSGDSEKLGRVATSTAIDEDGEDVKPFDAALQLATYDALRLRAGYRIARYWEPFVSFDGLLRQTDDSGYADNVARTRILPGLGLTFRRATWLDFTLRAIGIIDDQTDNKGLVSVRVSRAWKGIRASIDGRTYFGGVQGSDGGLSLAYGFPRDWFPGFLQLRAMLRYYREDVTLERPDGTKQTLANDDVLPVVPLQESYMGFAGLDWKL